MRKKKKIMIIAGEASGDMHGAHLVAAMQDLNENLEFFGIGGDALRKVGVCIRTDNRPMATVGVSEALVKLRILAGALRGAKKDLKKFRPDLLIVIDFPDFNLRVATAAKKLGIPVMYYISPQIWAWRTGRVKKIKQVVDHMVVIFPFEVDFYEQWNVPVTFVGHPLLDNAELIQSADQTFDVKDSRTVIGLLPGSRNEEISRLLPTMVEVAGRIKKEFPATEFAIPVASSVDEDLVGRIIGEGTDGFDIVAEKIQDVLRKATLLITASGTVTLEAAIACTPMIVVYKVSGLSYWLGKWLIQVKHIALANLVAKQAIVPELIQHEATAERIASKALSLIRDAGALSEMRQKLADVVQNLGTPGASKRAADVALRLL